MMRYADFFREVTGHDPFPYQERLGTEEWPDLMDVPTGLGKTAAIIVAWLWKRLEGDARTPSRLAYCLPMRVLVEQTTKCTRGWIERTRPLFEERGITSPNLQTLMGGAMDKDWRREPHQAAVLVGTQDMLLSRALMRGYGMSRYGWPVDYALMHNDCMWVYDEVQLMGPAVATSAQLEAFRRRWPNGRPSRSLWASATLRPDWLNTIDFAEDAVHTVTLRIADEDRAAAGPRLGARKRLVRSEVHLQKVTAQAVGEYAARLAKEVVAQHRPATQTIVVLNRVDRAQALYQQISRAAPDVEVVLLHARFRPIERRVIEAAVREETIPSAGRILVATQAVEAGVDITSATLFTELAPWSSMVQRFGRCNRYGEVDGAAKVVWIDLDLTGVDASPYTEAELGATRKILTDGIKDVGPDSLPQIEEGRPFGQVIRERDFIELFNTDSDLQGFDIDVAPFIRDQGPPQVQVFWRHVEDGKLDSEPRPDRDELCSVSMGQLNAYLKKKVKGNPKRAWRWDPLASRKRGGGRWVPIRHNDRLVPGSVLMLHCDDGGYDGALGFEPSSKARVPVLPSTSDEPPESSGGDSGSRSTVWVALAGHLNDVREEAEEIVARLSLDEESANALLLAASWHDVGKAHPAFQTAIGGGAPHDGLWAKSPTKGVPRYGIRQEEVLQPRPSFRHELASMLAWLAHNGAAPQRDLIAYLIAAHHGKVRMGLRAMPGENEPPDGKAFARGVWEGDRLPEFAVNGEVIAETTLFLDLMRMGRSEMGPSWIERTSGLLEEHGPFKLSWLEALLRIADWKGSSKPEENT